MRNGLAQEAVESRYMDIRSQPISNDSDCDTTSVSHRGTGEPL